MDIDIKEARTQLGMTQAELAHRLGVESVTVSRWERNKARPSQLAKRQIYRLLSGSGANSKNDGG